MSDFLNFNVIDEIIDGTPKYNITNNVDGTKGIELANEIIQDGTPLNKLTFDKLKKINSIMGYNYISGSVNPISGKIEYINNEIKTDDILDKQRILITPFNIPSTPATDFEIVENPKTITSITGSSRSFKLNNNKILLCYINTSNYTFYSFIYDDKGNLISNGETITNTRLFWQTMVKNDKIYILCTTSSSSIARLLVFNMNGELISNTQSNYYCTWGTFGNLNVLNDGRLICCTQDDDNYLQAYLIDNDYTTLLNSYRKAGKRGGKGIELANGNILISCHNNTSTWYPYFYLFDSNLNLLKEFNYNNTSNASLDSIQIYQFNNGNVLIEFPNNSNSNFRLFDSDLNLIKDQYYSTNQIYYMIDFDSNKEKVGFITFDQNKYMNYVVIDNVGNITIDKHVTDKNFISNGVPFLHLVMTNKNIMLLHNDNSNLCLSIIDGDGNVKKEEIKINNDLNFYNASFYEITNENIILTGGSNIINFTNIFPLNPNATLSFNGIDVDTMFKANKLYELIYKEDVVKFIANEITI